MNIIIVGDGKVGSALAEHLSQEEHDVVIVDNNDEPLHRASNTLDVLCVKGNGSSVSVMRKAGAATADLVVAATSTDELNMVCCRNAKNLGAKYTIARIRGVEYIADIDTLRQNMGIDMVINPEYATAVEISRLLRFPPAANIDTFFRGRVELVGFLLHEGDLILGQPLSSLPNSIKQLPILFCAAERGGDVIIPDGTFTPQMGDKLYVIGEPVGVHAFFRTLGRYDLKVRNVFIVGGGRISHYLASILARMGTGVQLVERQEKRCRQLAEDLPKAMIICGDGTDQELLEAEHMEASDAFVALTDRDEDNLIISLYARQQGVPKVVAKSNRQNYASIARSAGLDSVVSPKLITVNHILHVVRGMQRSKGSVMNALYKIANNKAEAMEFSIDETTRGLGIPLRDLKLKKGILIAAIVHNGQVLIPEGTSSLSKGDTVILISRGQAILDLNDMYAAAFPGGATL